MKIVFIGQKGIPAKMGGIERHVEELAKRLADYENNQIVVYVRSNYVRAGLKKIGKVSLVNLPSIQSKHLDAISHTFFSIFHLFFFGGKVDVIHFQSIGPSLLIPFAKIIFPKTAIISTFHSQCYFHQKWNFFAKLALKIGEYVAIKFSDKTIAISKELAKYAFDKYKKEVIYIPNGVPKFEKIKPNLIKKRWNLKGNSYIFSVSRLIRHKGLATLVKAFKKIKTQKKLVIVGEGFYSDDFVAELKNLAKSDKRIIFTGGQTGKVLAEIFSNGYFFIQPSEREGLSIALLEAMSYGKAILISDIPENKEALGNAGFEFENKNSEDLAFKMAYLLENSKKLKNKEILAKKRAEKFYGWDAIGQKTQEVYLEVSTRKNNFFSGKVRLNFFRN